jgi:Flp pilus assembly protein TadG
MRRLKSLACGEDGSELAEFGIAAGIFFTLVFGIIGFCQVLYAGNFVATAAQMGARYEMVRGTDWGATNLCSAAGQLACNDTTTSSYVQTYIKNMPHPGLAAADIHVTPIWMTKDATGNTCTAAGVRGCQVSLTVTYTYNIKAYLFTASIPFSITSTETIQN